MLAPGHDIELKLTSSRTFFDTITERSLFIKEYICLFYSHANALFFIIILKPFQSKLKNGFNIILRTHDNKDFALQQKIQIKKIKQAPKLHKIPKIRAGTIQLDKKSKNKEIFGKIIATLFFLLVTMLTSSTLLSYRILMQAGTNQHKVSHSKMKTLSQPSSIGLNLLDFKSTIRPHFTDPRVFCGERHGTFSFHFKRCYFIETHLGARRRTFDEQILLCESLNSTLAYPSSLDEARFMFRLHLHICGSTCRQPNITQRSDERSFLRLGLKGVIMDDFLMNFISVDNFKVFFAFWETRSHFRFLDRMYLSNYTFNDYYFGGKDYDKDEGDHFLYLKQGDSDSSVCLSFRKKLFGCSNSTKLSRSMCFSNFLQQQLV